MIDGVLQDVRTAFRSLLKARKLTATAVLTLGGGLALCLIVLSVGNAYLVRSLPYPEADRLFNVQYAPPTQDLPRGMSDLDWSSLNDVVEHPIAWDLDVFYMLGGAYPESAPGAWVTPGFVEGFGIRVALGRGLAATDFEPGRPMVALISHRLWQSRFGGDAEVVGRRFNAYVSDRPAEPESLEIIGVLPSDFWHMNPYTEVLAPLRSDTYPYVVRIREGVFAGLVEDRITALVRSGSSTLPAEWRVRLIAAQAGYAVAVRPVLLAVGAAAGLVLLIACANVSVLLLVRGNRREREIALRLALGASRGRVLRLLTIEAVLLGTAATSLGLVLSALAFARLAPFIERFLERRVPGGVSNIAVDPVLIGVAAACGLAATAAFALAPLAVTWRYSLAPVLGGGARMTGGGARRGWIRSTLIGLEVAVSLTLLTGALLMTASALRMLRVDFGMRAENVATASLTLRQQSYPDAASRAAFYERLLPATSALVQGRSAALGDWWPLQQPRGRRVEADGPAPGGVDAGVLGVSANYFSTLGITIRSGRAFTDRDRAGSEPIVIVSESLAGRLWPGSPVIGNRLRIAPPAGETQSVPVAHVVVGIAGDVRQAHADDNLHDVYVPLMQNAGRFAILYLPTGPLSPGAERDLRQAVAAVHAEVAVAAPRMLSSAIDQERSRPRFLAFMLVGFAAFAALLALLGMYGVVAYAVRQREQEIAVRMAVGADRRAITWLFLRQGGLVLIAGLAAGVLGAMGMSRVLEAQLFGVDRTDPRVLALTVVSMAVCGLIAVWWPARRAASTDPAMALKTE